ncbi:MAG: guanylate kinase [Agathobacter sp.]|uniref:guanylate kinase n=1 Tax=Agathobacter sp. TaxID=2021311 RepID=UPI00258666E1|nr:guanylate kinase [Agathobacter sp.]MCR5677957.1 guanylate kinase [Agathobacter sp.]
MEGFIIIVSGFSGAGKGTLMKNLLEKYPEDYALSISATSRKPRVGEKHGVEYFFIDRANFEDMIKKNQLLEYAEYVGNYYGTPRRYVENQLSMGKNVILEIEMQGAMKIKRNMPNTKIINIFVSTVDAVTLYGRLVGRGTESIDVIKKRMDRAVEESGIMEEYDYLIINDDLETATTQLHDIILNERNGQAELNKAASIASNKEFINDMKIKLLSFSKGELQ